MQVPASAFKAYDIRGIVGKGIDENFAEHLGRAFGSEARLTGQKAVVVGRDGRLSGPGLVAGLIRGLKSTGWTWSTSAPSPRRCCTTWPPPAVRMAATRASR
jgi:phosphomannomutase